MQLCNRLTKIGGKWKRTISTLKNYEDALLQLNNALDVVDPDMWQIIENEKQRQRDSIDLIPSEVFFDALFSASVTKTRHFFGQNFTSRAVMQALGSPMQNKYSEGRYYGGNQFIDQAEILCQKRALELFSLSEQEWGVNVQPLSGSPANLQVYGALLKPHDRIMGLDLPHGGHLSHGYQTETKKISSASVYYETMPYRLDERTGLIDYDTLQKNALLFRPKLIIAGASAYSRHYDYAAMRNIADSVNAYLMSDMAHISGLVAAGVHPSPFIHSDVVTTTTHKSLRGPRGAMIFFRKGVRKEEKSGTPIAYNLEEKVNFSVFPGHQGGPHNHTISALAVALKLANTSLFKEYQRNVVDNCSQFATAFSRMGYSIVSGGTDTHLFLLDLRNKNIDGARVEKVLELVNIAVNKNTVPGDKSALIPGGIRVGTPAMTTRGFSVKDFEKVAEFVDVAVNIAVNIKGNLKGLKLAQFKDELDHYPDRYPQIHELRADVVDFVKKFPVIGYDVK